MFDPQHRLDLTEGELSVIEAALHTQAKILSVQAEAGGSGARRRLNEVKRVLSRTAQLGLEPETSKPRRGWLGRFGAPRAAG